MAIFKFIVENTVVFCIYFTIYVIKNKLRVLFTIIILSYIDKVSYKYEKYC